MMFYKENEIYKVIRITSSQDNILGLVFDNITDANIITDTTNIEIIEWSFPNVKENGIKTPKKEILKQVITGLKSINNSLGTNYHVSKIYFCPFDIPKNRVYVGLTSLLIRHYHEGKEFKEE